MEPAPTPELTYPEPEPSPAVPEKPVWIGDCKLPLRPENRDTSPGIGLRFGRSQFTHYFRLTFTPNHPAMPFANRKKNILEDLFSSVLWQFNKFHPSINLKFIMNAFSKA